MVFVTRSLKRVFGEDNKTTETYTPTHFIRSYPSLLTHFQIHGRKPQRRHRPHRLSSHLLLALQHRPPRLSILDLLVWHCLAPLLGCWPKHHDLRVWLACHPRQTPCSQRAHTSRDHSRSLWRACAHSMDCALPDQQPAHLLSNDRRRGSVGDVFDGDEYGGCLVFVAVGGGDLYVLWRDPRDIFDGLRAYFHHHDCPSLVHDQADLVAGDRVDWEVV